MEFTRLGRTGLEVARIALGCMTYGEPSLASSSSPGPTRPAPIKPVAFSTPRSTHEPHAVLIDLATITGMDPGARPPPVSATALSEDSNPPTPRRPISGIRGTWPEGVTLRERWQTWKTPCSGSALPMARTLANQASGSPSTKIRLSMPPNSA